MSTSHPLRRVTFGLLATALALVATACPVDPPAPPSPFHPEALAAGNRIFLNGTPISNGVTVANPGGVTAYPADNFAGVAMFLDSTLTGNPVNDEHLGSIQTHVPATIGMFDADDHLRLDFGPDTIGWQYSPDGGTFGLTRYGPGGAFVDVYETTTMTVLRTFAWPLGAGLPIIQDFSRDGSRLIISGNDVGSMLGLDYPVMTATTTGTDPLVTVFPSNNEKESEFRFTTSGRIAFRVLQPGFSAYELRTAAIDGTDTRVLTTFVSPNDGAHLATEIGTGRVLVQMRVPGSSTAWQVVAVDDSADAAQSIVVGPSTDDLSLAHLVTTP